MTIVEAIHPDQMFANIPSSSPFPFHPCLPLPPLSSPPTHLEGYPRGEHEYEHELEVLVDGPQAFHHSLGVRDEEVERSRRHDIVREGDAAVEEHRGAEHNGREEAALAAGQTRDNERDGLVQDDRAAEKEARVARYLQRRFGEGE